MKGAIKVKKDEWKVKCGQCGEEVAIVKHVNKCKCGARIKVLDFTGN